MTEPIYNFTFYKDSSEINLPLYTDQTNDLDLPIMLYGFSAINYGGELQQNLLDITSKFYNKDVANTHITGMLHYTETNGNAVLKLKTPQSWDRLIFTPDTQPEILEQDKFLISHKDTGIIDWGVLATTIPPTTVIDNLLLSGTDGVAWQNNIPLDKLQAVGVIPNSVATFADNIVRWVPFDHLMIGDITGNADVSIKASEIGNLISTYLAATNYQPATFDSLKVNGTVGIAYDAMAKMPDNTASWQKLQITKSLSPSASTNSTLITDADGKLSWVPDSGNVVLNLLSNTGEKEFVLTALGGTAQPQFKSPYLDINGNAFLTSDRIGTALSSIATKDYYLTGGGLNVSPSFKPKPPPPKPDKLPINPLFKDLTLKLFGVNKDGDAPNYKITDLPESWRILLDMVHPKGTLVWDLGVVYSPLSIKIADYGFDPAEQINLIKSGLHKGKPQNPQFIKAAERIKKRGNLPNDWLDYWIVAGTTTDHTIPGTAKRVKMAAGNYAFVEQHTQTINRIYCIKYKNYYTVI